VRDLLRGCLASIFSDAGYEREVIVVDAASSDGSADMVRAEFPGAALIASSSNLGYSRGNNLGLGAARGEFLFVLNPDTRLREGAVSALLAYMAEHPRAGLLGPRLLDPDGSPQSSRRRWPTFWTALFESTWLQPYAPRRILDRYYDQTADGSRQSAVGSHPPAPVRGSPQTVDWVTGAALFLRREVLEMVGGLDEGFFMYSEELDWCRRIRAAGWEIVYVPAAEVIHFQKKSSQQAIPAYTHIRFQRSKIRYFRKYHGLLPAGFLRALLLLSFLHQLILESVKLALGHKPGLRRLRIATYWKVLRSGL